MHSFCQIFFPIRRVSAGEIDGCRGREAERGPRGRWIAPGPDCPRLTTEIYSLAWQFSRRPDPEILTAPAVIILMNRFIICLAAVLVASIGLAQDKTGTKRPKREGKLRHWPRAGQILEKRENGGNTDTLLKGLKDGLSGAKPLLNEEQVKETMTALQKEMMDKQAAANKEAGEKNKAEGEKFLEENKKKEGVKTTASGFQYKVLKEGTGESPKETDMVITNYKGTTLDGTEFDSSYKRTNPPLSRSIGSSRAGPKRC